MNNNNKRADTSVWKNFGYNLILQILTICIPILTTPYITRVLGAEGIGKYSYAYAIANYVVLFEMLGVNNYGNRTIARVRDSKELLSNTFFEIYYLQVIVSVVVILGYFGYCFNTSNDKILSLIMALYVVSGALDINWFFYGLEKFKITVRRSIFIKLLTTTLMFLIVKRSDDLYKYAFIYTGGLLLSQVIIWRYIKPYIKITRIRMKDILKHLKPNLTLFIPVVAISLYKIMDKVMLGLMSTKTEVGYYESCDKIVGVPIAVVTALGVAMLPRVSNLVANNDEKTSNKYLGLSTKLIIFLTAPLAFGLVAVSPEFVPVFFGEGFEKCIHVFQFLAPSCIFLAFANVIRTQYLIPYGCDRIYIISVIIGAISNLLINYILISSLQSVGVAIGTLFAEFIVCFIQCYGIRKQINVKMYLIIRALPVISENLLVMLMVKILVGAMIYLAFCITYISKFELNDYNKIKQMIRREKS